MTSTWRCAAGCAAALLAVGALACKEGTTDPAAVVAVSLDSIATPSVVAGDTLRDTLGIARPLRGFAYNYLGKVIQGYPVKYRAIDVGLRVDSLTGMVVADTVIPTPVRILVDAGGIQTQPVPLYIVPPPVQLVGVDTADTVTYSLTDTTPVLATLDAALLAQDTLKKIPGYLVSYAIQPQAPTDTLWARLVNGNGARAFVDTTNTLGVAAQIVQVRPAQLPDTAASLVVVATAKYRGVVVPGSPVRFVLRVRPNI